MAAETRRYRYPVGIQAFSKIRAGGFVYVDKTEYIYKLAYGSGSTFFLSRPRRFGKSLLLSTMQAYFEGRRELFEGLAIERLETEWERHPVLRVDLSTVKTRDVDELRRLLNAVLLNLEDRFGRDERLTTPGSRLGGLIRRAYEQTGSGVVLLIDEYDAPLLNVVDDEGRLQEFREVMREFYAPIKASDELLRLTFLTGITKFSQLSIFSELNNLRNISMNLEFAAVCGITEDELTGSMACDLEAFAARLGVGTDEALAQLKDYYDGYHFCEDSPDIYNPFSLMSAFADGKIESYWFGSGTPTFLVEALKKCDWDIADFDGREADQAEFDAPAERMDTPLPLLYQAGYLTIKDYDPLGEVYTLGIPNREVSNGLSKSLVAHAAPGALGEHGRFLRGFARCLRSGDMEKALQSMRTYLAGIPYCLGSKDERGFQTTFYLIFDLLGIQIDVEFRTATGRVDAVVGTGDALYVMEFKYGRSAAEALAQINEKGYMLPFGANGRRLVKAGVNFSPKERTIDDWIIEEAGQA